MEDKLSKATLAAKPSSAPAPASAFMPPGINYKKQENKKPQYDQNHRSRPILPQPLEVSQNPV